MMKLFVLLLLISGSLAFRERQPKDWGKTIQLVDESEPNGKIKLKIYKDTSDLDEILSNPDPRVVDEIFVSSQTIENMTRIFEVYGSKVTKVKFNNGDNVQYKAQDVFNVLNMLPSVETLAFSDQKKKFSGDVVGTLNMPKLKEVKLSEWSGPNKKISLDFLAKVLPENSITTFELRADKDFGGFLSKQRNIKNLKFEAQNPEFDEALNGLKLEKLELLVKSNHDEHLPRQQKFVKAVIKSQPNVKFLQLAGLSDYSNGVVNDEIFAEVVKLSKLESLVLSFDGLTKIDGIENLQNLKEIYLKSSGGKGQELFNKLSTLKFEKLEKFTISFYEFEPSKEIYQKLSQNLPNLKSFRATLNARQTINFYAKVFPQIEELSLRFGNANAHFEFGAAFDRNSKDVNRNIKKIIFLFQGSNKINADDFVAFLNMFPNLESLDISSQFPFTAEFFTKLSNNLNNLKNLELTSFGIDSRETFPTATTDAIKTLGQKLKFVNLNFGNTRGFFDRNYNEAFTFKPFIDAIKDVYKYEENSIAMLDTVYGLEIEAGKKQ